MPCTTDRGQAGITSNPGSFDPKFFTMNLLVVRSQGRVGSGLLVPPTTMAVLSIAKTVATSSPAGPSLEGVGADTGAEVVTTGAGVGLAEGKSGAVRVGLAVGVAVTGLPVGLAEGKPDAALVGFAVGVAVTGLPAGLAEGEADSTSAGCRAVQDRRSGGGGCCHRSRAGQGQ